MTTCESLLTIYKPLLTIPHHMGVSANNYGIANIRGENDEEKKYLQVPYSQTNP